MKKTISIRAIAPKAAAVGPPRRFRSETRGVTVRILNPDPAACPTWQFELGWEKPAQKQMDLGQCTWGYDFHHTDPQRHVPCVLGNLLAPRSADDIPPISPAAMASVQVALELLANLVGDHDHSLFIGTDVKNARDKARDILLTAKGLLGILRVETIEEKTSP